MTPNITSPLSDDVSEEHLDDLQGEYLGWAYWDIVYGTVAPYQGHYSGL